MCIIGILTDSLSFWVNGLLNIMLHTSFLIFMPAGGMTVLMLLVFNFLNKFQFNRQLRIGVPLGGTQPETSPLLPDKDDDLSSWDSSYDSASHDEEDAQDKLGVGGLDGKPKKDGENNSNPKRLCTICFDAPRDCFFLPCGHCVACFTCGTR